MKLLCFADAHITDEEACDQVVSYLTDAIRSHNPDLVIGLGDLFDEGSLCRELGPRIRDAMVELGVEWLFAYGNHDGSLTRYGDGDAGDGAFTEVFGPTQHYKDIDGIRFIVMADQLEGAEHQAFALEHANQGCVTLSHGIFKQEFLDKMEAKGTRLMLNGHRHFIHVQKGAQQQLQQYTLSPLRFGGRRGEPGSFALIKYDGEKVIYAPIAVNPPAMPCNQKILGSSISPFVPWAPLAHFPHDPDTWLLVPPLKDGDDEYYGGPGRLLFQRKGETVWDRSYGWAAWDSCTPMKVEYKNKLYLIIGGTWVKTNEVKGYHSLYVLDPETGEEHYRIKVIGVSAQPVIVNGIMYICGEWREIIAAELETGKILWQRRAQEEHINLSWEDGRVGGGWSICPPAVGRHVWVVNARGDLYGFNPETGAEDISFPGAVPCNPQMTCPYAPTLACAPTGYRTRISDSGDLIFEINRLIIEDTHMRIYM